MKLLALLLLLSSCAYEYRFEQEDEETDKQVKEIGNQR